MKAKIIKQKVMHKHIIEVRYFHWKRNADNLHKTITSFTW